MKKDRPFDLYQKGFTEFLFKHYPEVFNVKSEVENTEEQICLELKYENTDEFYIPFGDLKKLGKLI